MKAVLDAVVANLATILHGLAIEPKLNFFQRNARYGLYRNFFFSEGG
jgi:hypothetical protein